MDPETGSGLSIAFFDDHVDVAEVKAESRAGPKRSAGTMCRGPLRRRRRSTASSAAADGAELGVGAAPYAERVAEREQFVERDLRGARFVECDLTGVVMRGVEVAGMDIDAPWLSDGPGLRVNGST